MTSHTPRAVTVSPPEDPRVVIQGDFGKPLVTINYLSLSIGEARWLRDQLHIAIREAGCQ